MLDPSRAEVKLANSTSICLTKIVNEPVVGIYYVEDHIRKIIPKMVNMQNNVLSQARELHSQTIDATEARRSVNEMVTIRHFQQTLELIESVRHLL